LFTRHFPLLHLCLLALALFCHPALLAKDLAAYHVGDTVEEDITTPVALDVIDTEATAARKAAMALATPAIFRSYPDSATNAMTADFQSAFAATRSDFLAALRENFPEPAISNRVIASPAFERFVATFNGQSKYFPVSGELAADWARGGAGLDVQARLLDSLLQMTHRAIRPDDLPAGFAVGETLRLVPVRSPNDELSIEVAERDGKLITQANLTTVSRLRMLYRRTFPEDQQPLARALGAFLKPNCAQDAGLTQQARAREVSQLVVMDHFDAGQIVIRRGAVIDAKIEATLGQLREKTEPGQLVRQIDAERELAQQAREEAQQDRDRAQREQQAARQAREQAQSEHEQAVKLREQAMDAQTLALQTRERNQWLAAALAGVSAAALLVLFRLARQRKRASMLPVPVADLPPQKLQMELAPHLAQAVKDVLVQELAVQRGELLRAQQSAALEIAGLVHRLDELRLPLHERLRTYESQIQKLEKELAVRTEENRELLKLKIEMMRQQLESERAREQTRADWGTGLTE
jgi:hypothetical protein